MRPSKWASMITAAFISLSLASCGGGGASNAATEDGKLQTLTEGKLTIATGEPAWEPWVINDAPETGEGFEAAVAYAVAEKLGFSKENVVWVRTSFEEAIQPGPKNFDFNLQQYSITDERKQVVDFSSAYYKEPRVVITSKDNNFAGATSISELKDALFGAASGDISVEYTKTAIQPNNEVAVFNDLVAVLQALNAGQIDATVTGVAEGDYIVSSGQVENGVILGKIPGSEEATGGLGLLLEKDSPLTAPVTAAVDALVADGTIGKLAEQYLQQYNVADLNQ
ncbi:MAG: transporter substrate-binding domain-containing protein [Clostridiales bacterium]|nr:transporter substrate-binding domain-containing protein [Clostridiales bacterium]